MQDMSNNGKQTVSLLLLTALFRPFLLYSSQQRRSFYPCDARPLHGWRLRGMERHATPRIPRDRGCELCDLDVHACCSESAVVFYNRQVMAKFHHADFPKTSPDGEVGVMKCGLKGTSRICRGLVADVTGKSA